MHLRIDSLGGVASTARIDGHDLIWDQPASLGGNDLGPSPLDTLVASVGACAHYYAAAFLRARNYATDGVAVDVRWTKSVDRPLRILEIAIEVTLPSEVPHAHAVAAARAISHCPALATLVVEPVLHLSVTSSEGTETVPLQGASRV